MVCIHVGFSMPNRMLEISRLIGNQNNFLSFVFITKTSLKTIIIYNFETQNFLFLTVINSMLMSKKLQSLAQNR